MTILPFPEYAPDVSPFGEEESQVIQNVVPRKDGYGPVPSPAVYSAMLPAPCRGYFVARNADASISIFAAVGVRLYKLNATDFSWTDVSKGGNAYNAPPTADQWQFAQFNNFVLAVQINTAPQVFDLTSSTAFADLAGSPPQARYIAIVNRFVVLSGLGSSTPYRLQWSGLNSTITWTSGVNSSDFQDLPDGGAVRGVAGGEYGLIFQDAAIRRMTFVGGTLVFQIERVSQDRGIFAPLSLCQAGERVFYIGVDGFKMYVPGSYPVAIGKERVDRSFFADVDSSNLQLCIGFTEPKTTRVYWAYKSLAGYAGLFDKVLLYDYTLDRWAIIVGTNGLGWLGEYPALLSKPGLTLENLDAIAPGVISVTGAANNGSGAIRLTLSGLTAGTGASNTNLNIADTVEVYGVGGTTEANGNWPFTIIDATHIDLIGSAFVHAYTSGGAIGGSLDQLPFSLDDIATGALAQLSYFDASHRLVFLTGPNLEATLDTAEHEAAGGRRVRVKGFRPDTDAPVCYGAIGARESIQGTLAFYSNEQLVNGKGLCPANVSTRLARGRLRIPAGTNWSFASGIEPFFSQEGIR
jgi:hypothetical protein